MKGEVEDLLKEIVSNTLDKYIGFTKKLDNIFIALLLYKMRGNAINKKMFKSARDSLEKLAAQGLFAGLLYIYNSENHDLEVFGLGIEPNFYDLIQIDVHKDPKGLITEQYNGTRIQFEFGLNEIIGFSEGSLMSRLFGGETVFAPISDDDSELIKNLYDSNLKERLEKFKNNISIESINDWFEGVEYFKVLKEFEGKKIFFGLCVKTSLEDELIFHNGIVILQKPDSKFSDIYNLKIDYKNFQLIL